MGGIGADQRQLRLRLREYGRQPFNDRVKIVLRKQVDRHNANDAVLRYPHALPKVGRGERNRVKRSAPAGLADDRNPLAYLSERNLKLAVIGHDQ